MILQALAQYYERLLERGVDGLAPLGYSREKISYEIILSANGEVVDVGDKRIKPHKKPIPCTMIVPQSPGGTSNVSPKFLWGNTSYILGVTAKPGREKRGLCHLVWKP